jgi:hypothetical protein
VSSGEQSYGTDPSEYPISQAIPKIDGVVQTSGKVPCQRMDTEQLLGAKW